MKPRLIQPRPFAFTLLELLVVFVVVVGVLYLILPRRSPRNPAYRVVCLLNQKQLAIGLYMFAGDNRDRFPGKVGASGGGAEESMKQGDTLACYAVLTNYVPNPKVFRCPTDNSRVDALRGLPITRTNVSYFISLDASPTNSPTYTILTGDRHLILNSKPVGPGLFPLTTNQALEWSAELHSANKKPTGGNFSFADGHAEWVSVKSLSQVLARQNLPMNRVAVP